jgi:two-component system, cell cycle sensor histidine kinase and response regulator CckA
MEQSFGPDAANRIFYRCVEDCFEPIMITDRKGKLRYVNPAWRLVYGYSSEEAIGETPRLLRSELQTDEFYRNMWGTILDPKVGFWRGEVVNRAKDGHLVPVLLTITPYREASGDILGYMGIAVDLTEQKTMETQILRQDRLASIGLLASGLAHEIGNPLGTIQGRAEMIQMAVQGNPDAEKSAAIIIAQIDRIAGLIQSLLRVSRVPEAILLRPVELRAVLEEVALLMTESLRRHQIDLRIGGAERSVLAEPNYLQQLFLNLIINATHAIEEQKSKGSSPVVQEGERHFIEISTRMVQGFCEINVRDSGCGIPPANVSKLFQPFFTTKAAGKGTGMGLAIVSKLVDEMQGQVSVESEGLGYGATFRISLKV